MHGDKNKKQKKKNVYKCLMHRKLKKNSDKNDRHGPTTLDIYKIKYLIKK